MREATGCYNASEVNILTSLTQSGSPPAIFEDRRIFRVSYGRRQTHADYEFVSRWCPELSLSSEIGSVISVMADKKAIKLENSPLSVACVYRMS